MSFDEFDSLIEKMTEELTTDLYAEVDKWLIPWSEDNNVRIGKFDRDYEIRSFKFGENSDYLILPPKDGKIQIKKISTLDYSIIDDRTIHISELDQYLKSI